MAFEAITVDVGMESDPAPTKKFDVKMTSFFRAKEDNVSRNDASRGKELVSVLIDLDIDYFGRRHGRSLGGKTEIMKTVRHHSEHFKIVHSLESLLSQRLCREGEHK